MYLSKECSEKSCRPDNLSAQPLRLSAPALKNMVFVDKHFLYHREYRDV